MVCLWMGVVGVAHKQGGRTLESLRWRWGLRGVAPRTPCVPHPTLHASRLARPRYNAAVHWAKLEVPESEAAREALRASLRARFPVDRFNDARARLDPQGVLSNDWLDALFGKPSPRGQQEQPAK